MEPITERKIRTLLITALLLLTGAGGIHVATRNRL
jgi:hypothetical protein